MAVELDKSEDIVSKFDYISSISFLLEVVNIEDF